MRVGARAGAALLGVLTGCAGEVRTWGFDDPPPIPRAAPVFYLSPDGSDAGDGTLEAPWASITHATARMRGGGRLYLRAGVYAAAVEIRSSGTPRVPLHVAAYPGESPLLVAPPAPAGGQVDTLRIHGSWVIVEGLRVTNAHDPGQAIWIADGATHVTIEACEVFAARGQGILVSGSHALIAHNHVHHNGSHLAHDHGIYVEGGGNTIQANEIDHNWAWGIQLYRTGAEPVARNVIERNYVHSNGRGLGGEPPADRGGLVIGGSHRGAILRHNVVCGNRGFGILVLDGSSDAELRSNVSCYNERGGIVVRYPGPGTRLSHNVSYNDRGAALEIGRQSALASDENSFFLVGGEPLLVFEGWPYSLPAYQWVSGLDARSRVVDPGFLALPADRFDPADAGTYRFCNAVEPALCDPPP